MPGVFELGGASDDGIELRAVESIRGEFIREWEEDFITLSDGDPILESQLRKMSIYDFLFRILALRKKSMAQEAANQSGDPFGRK